MANKQKRKNKPKNNIQLDSNAIAKSLSSEELQHIIANALAEAETLKQTKESELRENETKEWARTIGATPIKRFFRLIFLPKSKIRGDNTTFLLLKLLAEIFFGFAKWISILLSVFIVAFIAAQYLSDIVAPLEWWNNAYLAFFAFVLFFFSRIVRIAAIEVDKIEDRNLLFGIFASITSFVSIIVAVIALIK